MTLSHCSQCADYTESVRAGMTENCKKCGQPKDERPVVQSVPIERPRMVGADRGKDRPS